VRPFINKKGRKVVEKEVIFLGENGLDEKKEDVDFIQKRGRGKGKKGEKGPWICGRRRGCFGRRETRRGEIGESLFSPKEGGG